MKNLRALYRLFVFAAITILKSNQIVFCNLLFGRDARRSLRLRQSWARWLLPCIGVRVHVRGTPPDFPCILVANHRSYLDPALLTHDVVGYAVSKAEVANWPVIGWGARVAGVLFLKRESQKSRKTTLNGIAEKVREGFPVFLFVEGTTHTHPTTIAFRPGAFKLAASEGFAIVPAAVEFRSPEEYWVGADTFLPHLFRRFGVKKRDAFVRYGPAIRSDDAQELMQRAKSWIDAELLDIRKGF